MIKNLLNNFFLVFISKNLLKFSRVVLLFQLVSICDSRVLGCIMLCFLLLELPETLTLGITSSVIQKSIDPNDDNLAWTLDRLIPKALFCLAFGAYALIDRHGELSVFISLLAIKCLIECCESNSFLYLSKALHINRRIFLECPTIIAQLYLNVSVFLDGLPLNGLAFTYLLGYAYVSAAMGRVIVSYCLYPKLPKPFFNTIVFREHWRFSKWIFLKNLVQKTSENIDSYIFTFTVGITSFGKYQVIKKVGMQLFAQLGMTYDRIMFPMLSRTKNIIKGFNLLKVSLTTTMIGMQLLALLFLIFFRTFGDELLATVVDNKAVLLFIFAGFFKTIGEQNCVILRSNGFSNIEFSLKLLRLVFYALGLTVVLSTVGFDLLFIGIALIISEISILVISLSKVRSAYSFPAEGFVLVRVVCLILITYILINITEALEFIPRIIIVLVMNLSIIFLLIYMKVFGEYSKESHNEI